MKLRSAIPVGGYVRTFIRNFARRPISRPRQVELIMDFLKFINDLMLQTPPWSEQSAPEFDNAKEAMEKLVTSRLYSYTFAPAVAAANKWTIQSDDLERDAVLDQKVALFSWVEEKHLDLPSVGSSRGFVDFAVQELLKINHYKAPRDKLICILNVCKVIFGLIRQLKDLEASADTFLPLLVLVVLQAKCPHLVSNVEYIAHFRSPKRLTSESGYYLTSLQGAITFIEQMDFASLSNIDQGEFERHVEQAANGMAAEAGRKRQASKPEGPQFGLLELAGSGVQTLKDVFAGPSLDSKSTSGSNSTSGTPVNDQQRSQAPPSEGGEASGSTDGPATSGFGALTAPLASATIAEDTRQFFQRTGEAAKMGIGRPIGALNKLWTEATMGPDSSMVGPTPPVPGNKLVGNREPSVSEKSTAHVPASSQRRGEALSPMPTPSTPQPQRNRLLALFADGSGGSEPASPSPGDTSLDQSDADQASSLKLPLPYWARNAVRPSGQIGSDQIEHVPRSRPPSASRSVDWNQGLDLPVIPPDANAREQPERASVERAAMNKQQEQASLETLDIMFPNMERNVCRLVLEGCHGNLEDTIDKLLAMG